MWIEYERTILEIIEAEVAATRNTPRRVSKIVLTNTEYEDLKYLAKLGEHPKGTFLWDLNSIDGITHYCGIPIAVRNDS